MDDKTRFDQLEKIIVELLHKQDRTIEEMGRLREAMATQQLILARLQNDLNRVESEVAAVRRLANETARILHKSVDELTIANQRNERLLQETAVILAENRLFQEETRQSFAGIRHELAENRTFQEETRTTLAKIIDLLTKP
ncbi:MAG TPA: hypothetical protein VFO93_20895 [Hymenobacter sp.]|uniref:hypothetical protein n=1 Tax=Hymenobacter sp. TaxID=1898978 RepID=UPI002D7EFB2B|nr:hypothetical protein [Hymenobacter sp.]HET9506014.1 hypothetical protein [Hymenobacter sp.]